RIEATEDALTVRRHADALRGARTGEDASPAVETEARELGAEPAAAFVVAHGRVERDLGARTTCSAREVDGDATQAPFLLAGGEVDLEDGLAYGRDPHALCHASTTVATLSLEMRSPSLSDVPTTAPSAWGASDAASSAVRPLPTSTGMGRAPARA